MSGYASGPLLAAAPAGPGARAPHACRLRCSFLSSCMCCPSRPAVRWPRPAGGSTERSAHVPQPRSRQPSLISPAPHNSAPLCRYLSEFDYPALDTCTTDCQPVYPPPPTAAACCTSVPPQLPPYLHLGPVPGLFPVSCPLCNTHGARALTGEGGDSAWWRSLRCEPAASWPQPVVARCLVALLQHCLQLARLDRFKCAYSS